MKRQYEIYLLSLVLLEILFLFLSLSMLKHNCQFRKELSFWYVTTSLWFYSDYV